MLLWEHTPLSAALQPRQHLVLSASWLLATPLGAEWVAEHNLEFPRRQRGAGGGRGRRRGEKHWTGVVPAPEATGEAGSRGGWGPAGGISTQEGLVRSQAMDCDLCGYPRGGPRCSPVVWARLAGRCFTWFPPGEPGRQGRCPTCRGGAATSSAAPAEAPPALCGTLWGSPNAPHCPGLPGETGEARTRVLPSRSLQGRRPR